MGQIFRDAKQKFADLTRAGQKYTSQMNKNIGELYRDNSQRIMKVFRDVAFNEPILVDLENDRPTEFLAKLTTLAENDKSEGAAVYENFLKTHGSKFFDTFKSYRQLVRKQRTDTMAAIKPVLTNEKIKGEYRKLITELPIVYQFFNDNIDYIQMSNVDKSMEEAVAADIMHTLATEEGNTQVASMIRRNLRFIKTLMSQRAMQQQKELTIKSVMKSNKELKEAAAKKNEAEFKRILAEKKAAGEQLTKEQRNKIWEDIKAKTKREQDAEMADQMKENNGRAKNGGLTPYQHLAGLVGLLPDELLADVALMVKDSCPDLNLMSIETAEMKTVVEAQPTAFVFQLIDELHEICDIFGLIDESKIMTKQIEGTDIELQVYAEDWMSGEKVKW